jgi:hypothetical protein
LRNDGGQFTDVTAEVGLVMDGLTTSVTAADMDGDGDLDLAVGQYILPSTCPSGCLPNPAMCMYPRSLLYENQNGHFVEVGAERGITANDPTLTMLFYDFDGDGDADLFVGNDVGQTYPNRMYINDGTGHFQDMGMQVGLARDAVGYGGDTMGVAVGDYDRDGILDLVATNFSGEPTVLFHCHADHVCVDSHLEGKDLDSSIPFMKWGVGMVDFNNDGWVDIFIANGDLMSPAPEPNLLYFNRYGTTARTWSTCRVPETRSRSSTSIAGSSSATSTATAPWTWWRSGTPGLLRCSSITLRLETGSPSSSIPCPRALR